MIDSEVSWIWNCPTRSTAQTLSSLSLWTIFHIRRTLFCPQLRPITRLKTFLSGSSFTTLQQAGSYSNPRQTLLLPSTRSYVPELSASRSTEPVGTWDAGYNISIDRSKQESRNLETLTYRPPQKNQQSLFTWWQFGVGYLNANRSLVGTQPSSGIRYSAKQSTDLHNIDTTWPTAS